MLLNAYRCDNLLERVFSLLSSDIRCKSVTTFILSLSVKQCKYNAAQHNVHCSLRELSSLSFFQFDTIMISTLRNKIIFMLKIEHIDGKSNFFQRSLHQFGKVYLFIRCSFSPIVMEESSQYVYYFARFCEKYMIRL